jgi:hypothetical protein
MILHRIEYTKKKDKRAQIKAAKDETVPRDDVYKSHTIHVPTGEPSNSLSRPPAKRKEGVVRPITQGKLLRAGGPSKVSVSSDVFFTTELDESFFLAFDSIKTSTRRTNATRKGCCTTACSSSGCKEIRSNTCDTCDTCS